MMSPDFLSVRETRRIGPLSFSIILVIVTVLLSTAKAQPQLSPSTVLVGASSAPKSPSQELCGRVVDLNSQPVAGVQVVLAARFSELVLHNGVLEKWADADGDKEQFGETNAKGWFRFKSGWPDAFYLLAAHPAGFAAVNGKEFQKNREIRLKRWGRIEGQLAKGRGGPDHRVWMVGLPSPAWVTRQCEVRYDTLCSADGRFVFEKVPAGWFEVGYLMAIGDDINGFTARTAVVVKAGEVAKVKVGGEGRPVTGRFVPPASYGQSVYFGAGPRTLRRNEKIECDKDKVHRLLEQQPEGDPYVSDVYVADPRTEVFVIASKDNQGRWWCLQPEDNSYLLGDAIWSDLDWRGYSFRINPDGSFRIEDVVPGTYDLTVDLQARHPGDELDGPFARYRGTIKVPAMTESYTDWPLDLGTLTLDVFGVGGPAPLFEAKTIDGKPIRLIDYRGRFVLLRFWNADSDFQRSSDLDRYKELHETYGHKGVLQIIGINQSDSVDTVSKYVAEHKIEWPEAQSDVGWDEGIFGQYRVPYLFYNVLVDPAGKIIGVDLHKERLTNTVRDALKRVPAAMPKGN